MLSVDRPTRQTVAYRKMERKINSDSDSSPTMVADKQFNNILKQVQNSGLNFQLQVSPFGALISLKKSLVKDKKGNFIVPSTSSISETLYNNEDVAALASKNVMLENKLNALENDYSRAVNDCAAAQKAVEAFTHENDCRIDLENEIEVLKNKIDDLEKGKGVIVKQANRGYQNNSSENINKLSESKTNLSNEMKIKAMDMDINYNVKVSNSFSPLLQLSKEKSPSPPKASSDLLPPLSTSLSSPCKSTQHCSSSQIPSGTPPSPRTPPVSPGRLVSTSESPQSREQNSDISEEETFYHEGNLISKKEAFKKILEAVQGIDKTFNP